MKKIIVTFTLLAFITACSDSSDEIASAYVSPIAYANYDCEQLSMEQEALVQRATSMGASIDKDASNDGVAMGVGLVLFWPALFFLGGDDEVKQVEFSQLKGKLEAVRSAMIQKKCTIANMKQADATAK